MFVLDCFCLLYLMTETKESTGIGTEILTDCWGTLLVKYTVKVKKLGTFSLYLKVIFDCASSAIKTIVSHARTLSNMGLITTVADKFRQ